MRQLDPFRCGVQHRNGGIALSAHLSEAGAVDGVGRGFLHRLHVEVHRDGATSISDFIGSRFDKSRVISALATVVLLFGTIPYVAL
ncbi:hypothetical protein ASE85_17330 [Sphingobium sp. Leaf26]|uniref:hypothetical protein n=1 Tax=Sphingobium sp. Leaf26 TaxID=1735693 RepID=UPI0006FF947E|nr:hypothetical protein [Sphingobium sp. Leaf26]KQN07989.1 hypothetical protein ASE85_17330 [Sphingobium sp. Leaf26]